MMKTLLENSPAKKIRCQKYCIKNIRRKVTEQKTVSKKQLRSIQIKKSSTVESFTVKGTEKTVSPTERKTAISVVTRSLTIKRPSTTSLTIKSRCVKVLLAKYLTEKSYTTKTWQPKLMRWIFLRNKINVYSSNPNGTYLTAWSLAKKKSDNERSDDRTLS